jgi:hypothetical protein
VTWTKKGQEFYTEARNLSDAAWRTHDEALGWSNAGLLDLLIPKTDLFRFAYTKSPQQAADELVLMGWWEDRGDAYWIGCRWPHWQQDRVQVVNRRDKWNEAQRRRRRHLLGDHSLCLPDNCEEASTEESTVESTPESAEVSVDDKEVSSDDVSVSKDDSSSDPERNGTEKHLEGEYPKTVSDIEWTAIVRCEGCGGPMTKLDPSQTCHPNCVSSRAS